ncbi:MAG: branched-chain amino acid aminotransferase [Hyphomicrobiales bacterium]|nr:branched-chain amino acid aminotransferase [Hyphomicrobiales bacterium]
MSDDGVTRTQFSRTWTFFEGAWREGNAPIMGPRTHAAWLGSMVFDGARAFDGATPDIDLHFARVNRSASNFDLLPKVSVEAWLDLARDGQKRFGRDAELYIRPMYWAENGPPGGIRHDPETTRWCLCIYEAQIPRGAGASITLSPFRKPTADSAPVDSKAGCLYPINTRALMEARKRGFDNCLMRDQYGDIAELGTANIFLAKDGVVYTPIPNGVFLDGITRQRVIALLRGAGATVIEKRLSYSDFQTADEIFSTSNFSKVAPVARIDDRVLASGPFYAQARALYWDYAHSTHIDRSLDRAS